MCVVGLRVYRLVLCVRVLVNACVRRYEAVGVVSACVGVFSCVCPRYLWSVDVCVAGPVLMSAGAGVSPRVVAQVQRFLTALRARGHLGQVTGVGGGGAEGSRARPNAPL